MIDDDQDEHGRHVDQRQLVRPLVVLKIHSGSVWIPAPDVKFVTMISSNDSAKASRAPATSAVRIAGKVTRRKVVNVSAPEVRRRLLEGCATCVGVGRWRCCRSTTTQNVAWPMMIVSRPNSMPIVRNAVFSARPVTMPGQGERQDHDERDRLPPEEPEAVDRERQQRAQDEGQGRRAEARLDRGQRSRGPDAWVVERL